MLHSVITESSRVHVYEKIYGTKYVTYLSSKIYGNYFYNYSTGHIGPYVMFSSYCQRQVILFVTFLYFSYVFRLHSPVHELCDL